MENNNFANTFTNGNLLSSPPTAFAPEGNLYQSQSPNLFSPEGYLYQTEYATNAAKLSKNNIITICGKDTVCIAAQQNLENNLMVASPITHQISDHIGGCIIGREPDGKVLIESARKEALKYKFDYDNPITLNTLANFIANQNQRLTQSSFNRPMGATIALVGMDHLVPCIYTIDPSGNVNKHFAIAFGPLEIEANSYLENTNSNSSFNTLSETDTKKYTLSTLQHIMGNSFNPDNVEMACVALSKQYFHTISKNEKKTLLR
jgi:20S proteasome alpha/beta subunit